jgi:hypothetical protein
MTPPSRALFRWSKRVIAVKHLGSTLRAAASRWLESLIRGERLPLMKRKRRHVDLPFWR